MNERVRRVAVLNLLVLGLHGWAHATLPVPLSTAQALIVYGVIVPGPFVAAVVAGRCPKTAAAVLLVSSAIALPFGVLHHFVWMTPDHINRIPAASGRALFGVSTVLLAPLELAGVLVGAASFHRRPPAPV